MTDASRRGSVHTVHGFCVSMLPHTRQISILSSAICSAEASGAISGSRFLIRNSAARRAERGPRPGRRASSWISRSISGPATALGTLLHLLHGGRAAQRVDQLAQPEQRTLVVDARRHLHHGILQVVDEAVLVDHALLREETAGQHVAGQEPGDRRRECFQVDVLFHDGLRWPRLSSPRKRRPMLRFGEVTVFWFGLATERPALGQNSFRPGGNGRPPVRFFILSCITASALRRASPCAAVNRSSTISFSSGLSSEGSIEAPFISPLPLSLTVTRPPPAVPSTSTWSS